MGARFFTLLTLVAIVLAGTITPVLCDDAARENATQQGSATVATHHLRVGLALGGGGTRGAAHVGVLKVLKQAGVPIDCIAGTSMGSIVGGLYCAGVPIATMEEKFRDQSLMKAFMTVPLAVRVGAAPILLIPRLFGDRPYDGLYKGNRFRKYLIKAIPLPERNIEELKVPFSAVSLNIVDGKVYRLATGSLGYAMQASSAVPGLRKPVQIGDRLFVDGGVAANVPVSQTKEMGADFIIAVDVDERFQPVPLDTFRKIGSVAERIVKWQLATNDAPLCQQADIVIHPNVDGIGLVSTRKADLARAIEAGEQAAREALPDIKKKLAEVGVVLAPPDETAVQTARP